MNIQMILALRYLNGRKLRTFLTTLAVIFGVVAIFGMNILIPTMLQSFQATMMAASNNVDLTITHGTSAPFPVRAPTPARPPAWRPALRPPPVRQGLAALAVMPPTSRGTVLHPSRPAAPR